MSLDEQDVWDPNSWGPITTKEYRIYFGNEGRYAVVDEADYAYLMRWRWCLSGKGYLKRSAYTRRQAGGARVSYSVYLHVEVMKRVEPNPPSNSHVLVDHEDLDKLNCRRNNLQWATYSMNNSNRADYNKKRQARAYTGAA